MRFDLSERIIWAGPNTMIYFHQTWKKNNYCRIHHLWIRQSVLNVDNVIVISALLYNNLAMTSPYWCPPSRLCLSILCCISTPGQMRWPPWFRSRRSLIIRDQTHVLLTWSYSISQEICTRFCCALLCCGYAVVHNEFTWSIYPYSPGLLCWHWGNR